LATGDSTSKEEQLRFKEEGHKVLIKRKGCGIMPMTIKRSDRSAQQWVVLEPFSPPREKNLPKNKAEKSKGGIVWRPGVHWRGAEPSVEGKGRVGEGRGL